MIEKMLDQLAEWQAQADLLEMDKRKLLDEVKVPAEVLAAQDDANKRRKQAEAESWRRQQEIGKARDAAYNAVPRPELPAEYLEAMRAADAKRDELTAEFERQARAARDAAAEASARIDADLQAQVKDVYRQIETRKLEIEAEFGGKLDDLKANVDKLTTAIKLAVIAEGKTVKAQFYQAVYVKGRITWNTDMLDGMIVAFPDLAKARKEGQPSVTLRKL
jgi:hypothetical protein